MKRKRAICSSGITAGVLSPKIAVRLNMLGCACVDMPIGYVEPIHLINLQHIRGVLLHLFTKAGFVDIRTCGVGSVHVVLLLINLKIQINQ